MWLLSEQGFKNSSGHGVRRKQEISDERGFLQSAVRLGGADKRPCEDKDTAIPNFALMRQNPTETKLSQYPLATYRLLC